MKIYIQFMLCLIVLFLSSEIIRAQCTITSQSDGAPALGSEWNIGNSFTACQTGYLSKISVLDNGGVSNKELRIYSGDGVGGSLLGSVTGVSLHNATTYSDWSEIDVYSQNISVTNGNVYTFYFTHQVTNNGINVYYRDFNIVNGGQMYQYVEGSVVTNPAYDLLFKVDIVDAAFPVELTSFTAGYFEDTVILNWKTDTEVNNYGFDVERTLSGNVQWELLSFVQGNGNSNSPKEYTFMDKPNGGSNFRYRLKQTDFDGQYKYSPEVEVSLDIPTDFSVKQNFPNPFNPTTKIEFSIPSDSNVEIKIFNVLGVEVSTLLNEHRKAGTQSVEFNASHFSSGVYFYKIVSGNYSDVKKMLLLR